MQALALKTLYNSVQPEKKEERKKGREGGKVEGERKGKKGGGEGRREKEGKRNSKILTTKASKITLREIEEEKLKLG